MSTRVSPGSPSQMIAALLRRQAFSPSRCRSRQLYETFSLPPTNHFAKGGFQSSTFFQGVNQETCSFAICAQKRSGLFSPSFAVLGHLALRPVRLLRELG